MQLSRSYQLANPSLTVEFVEVVLGASVGSIGVTEGPANGSKERDFRHGDGAPRPNDCAIPTAINRPRSIAEHVK